MKKQNIEIYDDAIPKELLKEIYLYYRFDHGWTFSKDQSDGSRVPITLGTEKSFYNFEYYDMKLFEILEQNWDVSRIGRTLSNCFRKGDAPEFHQDSTEIFEGKQDRTFIFYPNIEWEEEWGGHTLFKITGEDGKEEIKKIYTKPGRLVIFDGNIWHNGSPCTDKMPNYIPGRFSVAFQECEKDPEDEEVEDIEELDNKLIEVDGELIYDDDELHPEYKAELKRVYGDEI